MLVRKTRSCGSSGAARGVEGSGKISIRSVGVEEGESEAGR